MKRFLKSVSYIFQPLLMPVYGMILLMQMQYFKYLGHTYQSIAILGTFLFTGLLPAIPILMMLKRGQIKDLFISKREERTMPYLFSLLSYVFWIVFLMRVLNLDFSIVILAIGTLFSLLIIVFINFKWKISAHAAGMGGFVGSIFGLSWSVHIFPLPLITVSLLLSGLVAISRLYLKAHTLGQIIAGFCLGFVGVFGSAYIYDVLGKII